MPRGPSLGFNKKLTPSPALAEIVGSDPLARTEVMKRVWTYIKTELLQNRDDARLIDADHKLGPVIGKGQCSMFELPGLLGKHLS